MLPCAAMEKVSWWLPAALAAGMLALIGCSDSGTSASGGSAGAGGSGGAGGTREGSLPSPFDSASSIAAAIQDGRVSAVDVLELYLGRIDASNPEINAVVALDAEGARARAQEADEALANGESWGPLHGVPFTVKDTTNVEGLATTVGNPAFADLVAGGCRPNTYILCAASNGAASGSRRLPYQQVPRSTRGAALSIRARPLLHTVHAEQSARRSRRAKAWRKLHCRGRSHK